MTYDQLLQDRFECIDESRTVSSSASARIEGNSGRHQVRQISCLIVQYIVRVLVLEVGLELLHSHI